MPGRNAIVVIEVECDALGYALGAHREELCVELAGLDRYVSFQREAFTNFPLAGQRVDEGVGRLFGRVTAVEAEREAHVRVLMRFVSGYIVIVDPGSGPSAPHQSAKVKCRLLNIFSR